MDNTFEALQDLYDIRIVRIGFPLSISAYSNNKL